MSQRKKIKACVLIIRAWLLNLAALLNRRSCAHLWVSAETLRAAEEGQRVLVLVQHLAKHCRSRGEAHVQALDTVALGTHGNRACGRRGYQEVRGHDQRAAEKEYGAGSGDDEAA
jgi:hypothetical protein